MQHWRAQRRRPRTLKTPQVQRDSRPGTLDIDAQTVTGPVEHLSR